jgi:hypothetical protein
MDARTTARALPSWNAEKSSNFEEMDLRSRIVIPADLS